MVKRRLAAIVLAIALFGANTAMASMCEVYCAGVGKKSSDHHHPKAAGTSGHHHMHAQHRAEYCSECSKGVAQSVTDCRNFAEGQALQESSRILSDDHANFQPVVTKSSTGVLPPPLVRERFSSLHSPPNVSNFQPLLVSLRI